MSQEKKESAGVKRYNRPQAVQPTDGEFPMRRSANFFFAFFCALLLCAAAAFVRGTMAQTSTPQAQPNGDQLVYADFENAQDKRPLSKRGGFVQLVSYQEST